VSDQEKVCINLSVIDLGKIDLLVSEGYYANRTDFIKDAIRNGLDQHKTAIDSRVHANSFVVGILSLTAKDLEEIVQKGKTLDIYVVGMLHISSNVPPALAEKAIGTVTVNGVIKAEKEVLEVLNSKRIRSSRRVRK
jgi:Arc/MetJ-type ribon-helix-helix transcriptional regulator